MDRTTAAAAAADAAATAAPCALQRPPRSPLSSLPPGFAMLSSDWRTSILSDASSSSSSASSSTPAGVSLAAPPRAPVDPTAIRLVPPHPDSAAAATSTPALPQGVRLLDAAGTLAEFAELKLPPSTAADAAEDSARRLDELLARSLAEPDQPLPPPDLRHPRAMVSSHPLTRCRASAATTSTGLCYFEATVSACDPAAVVAVGLATAGFADQCLPGFAPVSVALLSDGSRCTFDRAAFSCFSFAPNGFAHNDVVGCGYLPSVGNVFFTLNGEFLGVAFEIGATDVALAGADHPSQTAASSIV
ncbi:hypothetical protein HK405_015513, partial [Cladochytrium tenue]